MSGLWLLRGVVEFPEYHGAWFSNSSDWNVVCCALWCYATVLLRNMLTATSGDVDDVAAATTTPMTTTTTTRRYIAGTLAIQFPLAKSSMRRWCCWLLLLLLA